MLLEEIAAQFSTEGRIGEIRPHGTGHINDNYHCRNAVPGRPDYLLQRINHHVFRDVGLLMDNMALVTGHIAGQLGHYSPVERSRRSLTIIPTGTGGLFYLDPEGNHWRMLNFIGDHAVFEQASDPGLAYEGARMFGEFVRMLSSLQPSSIGESIPRFHDIQWRLEGLRQSIAKDLHDRARLAGDEISYVESRVGLMSTILRLGREGVIPMRVTHNDTKINNVLFDSDRKGLCVVDLDTVMPGFVHYDFGDGIRTFTNTGQEDDRDPGNVSMDMELYRAFASGFLDATREILTRKETETLVYAGVLFPFIMGVRFLTDFIAGDVYYKIGYEDHNLVRARAQFALARDGESRMEDSELIIRKLVPAHE